ncbi:MAG: gluconate 2-dehydrogenase subunit 3 family protein [Halorientalis sp.]
MELTRRDALAALTSAGVVVGGGAAALARRESLSFDSSGPDPATVVDTLVAVAEVVYPSAVSGVGDFVEAYSVERIRRRPDYRAGVREAVGDLNAYVAVHADAETFAALDVETRDVVLRRLGIDAAEPEREGTVSGRARYYLVNELLYALYTTPTGGELVGISNPQGYPGGRTHAGRPE